MTLLPRRRPFACEQLEQRLCLSAVAFDEHVISDYEAERVYAVDIDGDGDVDVLSWYDGEFFAWHESLGGKGAFGRGSLNVIRSLNVITAYEFHFADLDGDGDADILAEAGGKVAWYENVDGKGRFGTKKVISTDTNDASLVSAADFDGDGDLDVVATIRITPMVWYENVDGKGTFGEKKVIEELAFIYYLDAGDVDGDGDMDVLFRVGGENNWLENIDGKGSFGLHKRFYR